MEPPKERLPELGDAILAAGSRLRVTLIEGAASREIEIVGNRHGLRALASICSGLAGLTDAELRTPANHYHLDEHFWGTEQGSTPLTVCCREDGWTENR
jgi:hypothetical protein